MRKTGLILGALALFWAAPAWAQKDFLTADEVDQVREAQDPNERLPLYVEFAKQRLDQVEQLMKENKPGRAVMVHDLLDEYNKILDAIDTVTDDALAHKLDVSKGIKSVGEGEKGFLPLLEKLRDSNPPDLGRYEFQLTQAIDTTRDGIESAQEDVGKRSSEVAAREKQNKKELEGMMQPKDLEQKKAEEAKQAADQKKQRKKPTLLKPGETIKGQQ